MKVLVVDDDRITVDMIIGSIAWNDLEIYEVLTAYDGIQAREIVTAEKPDIILCDIEMPLSSGIDFLRWIKVQKYSLRFIFLTCHDNFEFAREALVLGANDYILKPLHPSRLTGALLKAVREIKLERSEWNLSKIFTGKTKYNLIRNFFRELMDRSIPGDEDIIEEELQNRRMTLNPSGRFRLVLACVEDRGAENQEWDKKSFHYAFSQLLLEAVLERLDYPYMVDWGEDGYYCSLLIAEEAEADTEILEEHCRMFIDICGQYLRTAPSCYLSVPVMLPEFADIVKKLREMAGEAGLLKGKVRLQGQVQDTGEKGGSGIDSRIIMDTLERKDKLSLNRYLKKSLQLLKEDDKLTPPMMHYIHQDIMQSFYVWLLEREVEAHRLFMEVDSKELYENSEKSVVNLLKWVNYLFDASMNQVEKMKQTSVLVTKAKEYVKYHYMDNIGRDEIAASIFVTPNYLSKIFHEETGIVLKEYITQVRIDAAKSYLRSTDHSIAYIATETGFENVSYFSTIFKKVCGMTPKAYRTRNR